MPAANAHENIVLGPLARLEINGTRFAKVSGTIRITADDVDSSDSEVSPFKTNKSGMRAMEVNITAHATTEYNPHAAPYDIKAGFLVSLRIFPFGDASDPYESLTFRIFTFEESDNVQGSQPVTITLSGRSSGVYTEPTSIVADNTFPV